MAIDTLNGKNVPIKLWAPINEVESQALDQLKTVASLPWVFHHVAVMPDVHLGRGCTIGSVIAMKDAVSPSAVGVDIGCGMAAVKTNLQASHLPDDLKAIRHQIERDIPVGFNAHKRDQFTNLDKYGEVQILHNDIVKLYKEFNTLNPKAHTLEDRSKSQLGSLGGGNHFIELCLDTDQNVWLMLHSGSRNLGKELAEVHINKAKALEHNQLLEDRELAVFLSGTQEMKDYRHDLMFAQEYAFLNRRMMLELYKAALRGFFPSIAFDSAINCHHNYVSEEHHYGEDVIVTRKGAISAKKGEFGIIPGSMGTRSFIVEGLGNPESFNSASHGAGRKMSRSAAKKAFTTKDLEEQTSGVECRKDQAVVDEIPGAYKKIEDVMKNQSDLVKIVAELKQILCVKG